MEKSCWPSGTTGTQGFWSYQRCRARTFSYLVWALRLENSSKPYGVAVKETLRAPYSTCTVVLSFGLSINCKSQTQYDCQSLHSSNKLQDPKSPKYSHYRQMNSSIWAFYRLISCVDKYDFLTKPNMQMFCVDLCSLWVWALFSIWIQMYFISHLQKKSFLQKTKKLCLW